MTGLINKVEVHLNFVVIGDDIVNRPPYLAIGEWLELWQRFERLNEVFSPARTALRSGFK